MKKKAFTIFAGTLTTAALGLGCFLFSGQYAAEASMVKTESDENVTFQQEKDYWLFDSKFCTDTALIFYGGAKVEELAYSGLLNEIAESGTADVFLIDAPANIPLFGKDNAEIIMNQYADQYETIYFGGHSLGGSVAGMYVAEHQYDNIKGLIFLASYNTEPAPESIDRLLYVYGDCDGVLTMENFQKDLEQEQKAEKHIEILEIKGGNHANFGNYGIQKKDNPAEIEREEQVQQTVNAIRTFVQS